jgi:hypothetical protein
VQIIAIAAGIASLVCWIIVLVKIFQAGDVLWGILGLCGIVAFIYGWINVNKLGIRNVMLAWTAAILVGVITNMVVAANQGVQ